METSDLYVCRKLIQLHDSAESRGLEFDMSIRKVRALLKTKTCYFTGVKFCNMLKVVRMII